MILIATSSVEAHSYSRVCHQLASAGAPHAVFLTDRVLAGEDVFLTHVSPSGEVTAIYGATDISPSVVCAGWYWKVTSFRVPGAENNVSRQLTMVNEVTALHNAIWSVYADDVWISSPASLWRAERKLAQLLAARRVGFSIPETLIGSDWQAIEDELLSEEDAFVVKMARGVIADQNVVKGMQTTRVDRMMIEELRLRTLPFPGIYQPLLRKAREWRVTIIGDEVFAAAVYADCEAVVDWRQHQISSAVRFQSERLPCGVTEKCVAYLHEMDLGYGAFDLVEEPDGNVVFLECNPSGQFSWLEERLGLKISSAIAAELLRIARAHPGEQRAR